MTPLGRRLIGMIGASGPIGVDRYMALALADPDFGYYMTRDPFGVAGDFTTAPEISQVFGEIIGAWCVEMWRMLGAPRETSLIELGPGRGTLAADLLRASAVLPACRESLRLHLVETSPVLRQRQAATLAAARPTLPITWHDGLETVPDGPFLLITNEFFDALPIRQTLRAGGKWYEREIGLDGADRLAFVTGRALDSEQSAELDRRTAVGDDAIVETHEAALTVAHSLGRRLMAAPGAALLIDYGYSESGPGETLQAVQHHRFVHPLAAPGEADLTAHVDFGAIAAVVRAAGAGVWGPVTQRQFLITNGALLRMAMLERHAADDAGLSATIRRGVERLLDPDGMGTLFQVMATTSPGLPRPAGF